MDQMNLGRTELRVSRLGLGTVKIGRKEGVKYPRSFDLPSDSQVEALINTASDLGINVIDTAPSYGTSEARIGSVLKGKRHLWNIITKVGEEFEKGISTYNFSPESMEKSVLSSLKRLQTDYLDALLLHSNGSDLDILGDDNVIGALNSFKKRGLVRYVGMSTRTVEGGLRAAEILDIIMVATNPFWTKEEIVLQKAKTTGCGVLAKKVLNSGHLDDDLDMPTKSIRFALSNPAVGSAIIGTIDVDHLRSNVEIANTLLKQLSTLNSPSSVKNMTPRP